MPMQLMINKYWQETKKKGSDDFVKYWLYYSLLARVCLS